MIITPHALAGSAVSNILTNNIFVAFLLGIIIHFILDAIPHFDQGTIRYKSNEPDRKPGWGTNHDAELSASWPSWVYITVVIDIIITVLIYFLLLNKLDNFPVILAGALGGISIDLIDNPVFSLYKLPVFNQLHWLHHKIHFDLPKRFWFWGIPIELIIIGGSLWYLLKFSF